MSVKRELYGYLADVIQKALLAVEAEPLVGFDEEFCDHISDMVDEMGLDPEMSVIRPETLVIDEWIM